VNIGSIDSLKVIKKAQEVNALQKNHKAPIICYEWLIAANIKNPVVNQEIVIINIFRFNVSTAKLYRQSITV
jgi:hypothetical protein